MRGGHSGVEEENERWSGKIGVVYDYTASKLDMVLQCYPEIFSIQLSNVSLRS